MQDVPNQDDSWSCGANSAVRIMKFYKDDITYDRFRQISSPATGITFRGLGNGIVWFPGEKAGSLPEALAEDMTRLSSNRNRYAAQMNTSFDTLTEKLHAGNPVMILIVVDSSSKVPLMGNHALHWIVLSRYDATTDTFSFIDTVTNNTAETMTRATLQQKWYDDFNVIDIPIPNVVRGTMIFRQGAQSVVDHVLNQIDNLAPQVNLGAVGNILPSPAKVLRADLVVQVVNNVIQGNIGQALVAPISAPVAPVVHAVQSLRRGDVGGAVLDVILPFRRWF